MISMNRGAAGALARQSAVRRTQEGRALHLRQLFFQDAGNVAGVFAQFGEGKAV